MRRSSPWTASVIALTALALNVSAAGAYRSLVPWKVIERGAAPEKSALVLFWVPASPEELRRSPLLTSDELTLFSAQCVAMRIVRLDDRETLERLAVNGDLPVVVLADGEGKVIARAAAMDLAEVEVIVREELRRRAESAEAMLDEAAQKAHDGETDAAIALYRRVSELRCECPRQGRAAQRALKKLEK